LLAEISRDRLILERRAAARLELRRRQLSENSVYGIYEPSSSGPKLVRCIQQNNGIWIEVDKDPVIKIPLKIEPFITKKKRFKVAIGGRSGGKSISFGNIFVSQARDSNIKTMCLREVQNSISDSVHALLKSSINSIGYDDFSVTDNAIRIGEEDAFKFKGLLRNPESVKSSFGFSRSWIEEAQSISKRSLEELTPSIREKDSELWFSANPSVKDSAFSQRFINPFYDELMANGYYEDDLHLIVWINYHDNPWHPQELESERIWAKNHLSKETYDHIWLGYFNEISDDQVFKGHWTSEDFDVDKSWSGPYYGADWGFAADPSTLIECYIDDSSNTIYVSRELYQQGVEVDHFPGFYSRMAGVENYAVRGDNARPEIISYLKRHGYPKVQAAKKWNGSIEDGISKLKSFDKIVIHERCKNTISEFRNYKYKKDRNTDDILPVIIDKFNHSIDAIRYAIEPITKRSAVSFWDV
jgi:phage terminase large subunit